MDCSELKTCIEFHRKREREEEKDLEKRREEAYQQALKCAERLADAGAKRVYLFGSLTRPEEFQPWSDVDLAVEELPVEANFFGLIVTLKEEYSLPINLVKIEKVPYGVQKRIREGEILYDQK